MCIPANFHDSYKETGNEKYDCCNSFDDNKNSNELDDDDAVEEEEECALVVFSGRFPQLPLTEQNILPANHHHHDHCHDDDDDHHHCHDGISLS